jgi:lipoate-protein ligase B
MLVEDLGQLEYRAAWKIQEEMHQRVLDGDEERLLLVEHPPVITFGRRPGIAAHLLASPQRLEQLGIQTVETDRGGDITFHGPGQLVAYPIVRLADHRLSVSAYVHRLEQILIDTLALFGVDAQAQPGAVGVWVASVPPFHPRPTAQPSPASTESDVVPPPVDVEPSHSSAKIAAVGVRIRRGVTLHGVALNVTTDLSYFDLIIPCGLSGRSVTSLQQLLGHAAPDPDAVKNALQQQFTSAFPPKKD